MGLTDSILEDILQRVKKLEGSTATDNLDEIQRSVALLSMTANGTLQLLIDKKVISKDEVQTALLKEEKRMIEAMNRASGQPQPDDINQTQTADSSDAKPEAEKTVEDTPAK